MTPLTISRPLLEALEGLLDRAIEHSFELSELEITAINAVRAAGNRDRQPPRKMVPHRGGGTYSTGR